MSLWLRFRMFVLRMRYILAKWLVERLANFKLGLEKLAREQLQYWSYVVAVYMIFMLFFLAYPVWIRLGLMEQDDLVGYQTIALFFSTPLLNLFIIFVFFLLGYLIRPILPYLWRVVLIAASGLSQWLRSLLPSNK